MDFKRKVSGKGSCFKSQRVGLSRCRPKSCNNSNAATGNGPESPQESNVYKLPLFKSYVESTPKTSLTSENYINNNVEPHINISPGATTTGQNCIPSTEDQCFDFPNIDISPIRRPHEARPRHRPNSKLRLSKHRVTMPISPEVLVPKAMVSDTCYVKKQKISLSELQFSQNCPDLNKICNKTLTMWNLLQAPSNTSQMLSLDDSVFKLVDIEETESECTPNTATTNTDSAKSCKRTNSSFECVFSSEDDNDKLTNCNKTFGLKTEIISAREVLMQSRCTSQSFLNQDEVLFENDSFFEQVDLEEVWETSQEKLVNSSNQDTSSPVSDEASKTSNVKSHEHKQSSKSTSCKDECDTGNQNTGSSRTSKKLHVHFDINDCQSGSDLEINSIKKPLDSRADTMDNTGIETIVVSKLLTPNLVVTPTSSPFQSPTPICERIKRALVTNAQKPIQHQKMFSLKLDCSSSPSQNSQYGRSGGATQTQSQFFDLGPFFGLPSHVKFLIQQFKGIEELYPWQEECLNLPALKKRKNLVYALPTSGGKTLVAEILIFRELLCYKTNVVFILPFVSIVQEKVRALSSFGLALNFFVEEYASSKGIYPPRKRRRKQSVYVSTIEKAVGLINSLIETDRISEIGLVVVDELHFVGDNSGRGSNLEGLLTKILFLPQQPQIVGMSATIGNIEEIATFLKAETYTQNFRPVELKEYVKLRNSVYSINPSASTAEEMFTLSRTLKFSYTPKMLQIDPDMLTGLVMEVIPNDSCLVFCATKQNCENVALLLCRLLPEQILREHKIKEKKILLDMLLAEGKGSICPILSKTLVFGIAYHHAGLTADERRMLEEAYLAGTICCICCTSTLAAGVNLPAKRVILRSPYIGMDFMDISRYKQMVGRAGRAGLGDSGESILLCSPADNVKVGKLLMSKMNQVNSSLHLDNFQGLRNLVLSAISLGIAINRECLHRLATHTLLHVQAEQHQIDIFKATDSVITTLFKMNAIRTSNMKPDCILNNNITVCMLDDGSNHEIMAAVPVHGSKLNGNKNVKQVVISKNTELLVNNLGKAAIKGSIDLSRAHILLEDLRQAQKSLVCLSHLHLLYLVTPYDFGDNVKLVNTTYFAALSELDAKDMQTARTLGLDEGAMTALMRGNRVKGVPERAFRRFYVTLMLKDLWYQKSAWEVAEKFEIPRGFVQNLMGSSAAFASCVVRFCEELEEMWAFKDLIGGLTERLAHCCTTELLPLMELPSVKKGRARQLYQAGYKTLKDVAQANAKDLVSELEPLPKKVAHQIIAAAKLLLMEKVETLREEAENVLEGVLAVKDIEEWMNGTIEIIDQPTQLDGAFSKTDNKV